MDSRAPARLDRAMSGDAALALLLILCGPAVGSFLGVLADRLPRGEPVGLQRSACRSCGRVLRPAELIPLVSFPLCGGRCRGCGAAIPPWLLYLEIAAGGLGMLAVLRGGGPAEMALMALILWTLLGLAACDLLWFRLPDPLTAALLGLALLRAGIDGDGLGPALVGALCGSGAFWALRAGYRALRGREGMGLGDVKLMAGIGALAGLRELPLVVLLAALAALAAGLVSALAARRRTEPAGESPLAGHALPFGAALAAAAAGWLLVLSVP